jgi:hypothetical protein
MPLVQRLTLIVCRGLMLGLPAEMVRAQALLEMREDVRTNSPGLSDEDQPPRRARNDSDGDGYDDSDDWGSLFVFALVAPFWGPAAMMGDDYPERGYFLHFPHQYDRGYMLIGAADIGELPEGQEPYVWAARSRTEFGTDFGRIDWIGGHVLIESSPRFGIESDFRYVREGVVVDPHGSSSFVLTRYASTGGSNLNGSTGIRRAFAPTSDALWFGDGNALFRFAQSEWLVMRTGLGFNFLSDTSRTDFGFNFTYGGDFFPIRPFVVSGELDLGTLGPHERLSLSRHARRQLASSRGVYRLRFL